MPRNNRDLPRISEVEEEEEDKNKFKDMKFSSVNTKRVQRTLIHSRGEGEGERGSRRENDLLVR